MRRPSGTAPRNRRRSLPLRPKVLSGQSHRTQDVLTGEGDAMQPLEAGEPRTIGAYRLLGRLGAGGMGRVYLGRSAGGRTVAVKIVHPHFASDEEFRARFRREVEAARRVGGEWTAPVLDADPDAPVPWVATGYVAGPSLDRAVASHGPLPQACVRAVGAGLARALVAVHGLGLVHRDVKPSNVMLTLDGPRLIDFGIARATDGTASLTSTGVSIGSPGYMSPEQILGKGVTAAADVFSLGAVLAFAASGRPPFTGDNSATLLYKVVHEPPELGAIEPGQLRELVAACLAKTAADRPEPRALADALGGALGAPGWLPAPLVEEASRAAVALLDLEAGPAGGLAGAGAGAGAGSADPWPVAAASREFPSGPVPFTASSYGSPAAGGFGPADASYGAGPYSRPRQRTLDSRVFANTTHSEGSSCLRYTVRDGAAPTKETGTGTWPTAPPGPPPPPPPRPRRAAPGREPRPPRAPARTSRRSSPAPGRAPSPPPAWASRPSSRSPSGPAGSARSWAATSPSSTSSAPTAAGTGSWPPPPTAPWSWTPPVTPTRLPASVRAARPTSASPSTRTGHCTTSRATARRGTRRAT
ncbi:serine/threonine protein kinase [Streptomyces sp. Mg1]|nr:serine/threonine protein kinase [Streptomyces sp. Mg1]